MFNTLDELLDTLKSLNLSKYKDVVVARKTLQAVKKVAQDLRKKISNDFKTAKPEETAKPNESVIPEKTGIDN